MADEKTEEPTEHKLEKSREEGNFPKSQEFASSVVFGVVLLAIIAGGNSFFDRFRVLIRMGLEFGSKQLTSEELLVKASIIFSNALWLIIPIALISAVAGVIGMVAQIGFHVSFKPIAPKLENISPVKGIKKIFSMKALLELVQMIVRALIIGFVGWSLIKGSISLFAGAAYQTLPIIAETAWHMITRLMEFGLLCFLILSGCDYAMQHWQYMKGQRMSKDEIKREYKESEGDPLIKSERMQLARENARSGPSGGLGKAKVVLTNPTHYAVALAYEPGTYDVPTVVARGADLEAKYIREEAAALGIPIISNPPLARALYKIEVDCCVPKEFYGVIAAVLLWLQRIDAMGDCTVGVAPVQEIV
jgi:type III secretion protein U